MVIVTVASVFVDAGEKETIDPSGWPLAEKLTTLLKPL